MKKQKEREKKVKAKKESERESEKKQKSVRESEKRKQKKQETILVAVQNRLHKYVGKKGEEKQRRKEVELA